MQCENREPHKPHRWASMYQGEFPIPEQCDGFEAPACFQERGAERAYCGRTPKRIVLWAEGVTCPDCRKALRAAGKAPR